MSKLLHADLAIIGGGTGGFAAAWSALQSGLKVIMSEEYDRVGGQFTSQAVPPDEHPWIEHCGCTSRYRALRHRVRDFYKAYYPLTSEATFCQYLNPGNGFVSALCHEPQVSRMVMDSILMPYLASSQLTLLLNCVPIAASVDADAIVDVTLRDRTGQEYIVTATSYIDASELGDLLPLCQAEHVVGAEAQSQTQEPHAAAQANPLNQQSHSWCFVVDYQPEVDNTIPKPRNYDFWRTYIPELTPPWSGPLLSWSATHPITLNTVERSFDPLHPQPERGPMDLWTFRRIADRHNFTAHTYESDIVLVNWPQIDYMLGPLVGVTPEEKQKHLQGARDLSLSMLYWMQTEAPRRDGGCGWPGLRLRPEITGTADGLAAAPYIREARRIQGCFTILEQHLSPECQPQSAVVAQKYWDSVGIGAYRIDLHPSTSGQNYIDVSALPFQIPLGALIPRRLRNLLAGGKTLATTHITNGCYRLHPVEWNVGEVAGLLSAYALHHHYSFHQIYAKRELVSDFQDHYLLHQGVELEWPDLQGRWAYYHRKRADLLDHWPKLHSL